MYLYTFLLQLQMYELASTIALALANPQMSCCTPCSDFLASAVLLMPFSCCNLSLSDGCVYIIRYGKKRKQKRLNKPGKGQSSLQTSVEVCNFELKHMLKCTVETNQVIYTTIYVCKQYPKLCYLFPKVHLFI